MSSEIENSYRYCQRLARRSASSFYLAFWLLPANQRRSMCALYAFLRSVDDIGDGPGELGEKQRRLAEHRKWFDQTVGERSAGVKQPELFPALGDTVRRFQIPRQYLASIYDGMAMDLAGRRYATRAELEEYCYCVASVVGIACIHIWGFTDPSAIDAARRLGIAFQWTNILRDLREDLASGRLYLPLEDVTRFDCSEDDLRSLSPSKAVADLLRFEVAQTRRMYAAADELLPLLSREGRRACGAMVATYRELLERIARLGPRVLHGKPRLPTWKRLTLALRGAFRPASLTTRRPTAN